MYISFINFKKIIQSLNYFSFKKYREKLDLQETKVKEVTEEKEEKEVRMVFPLPKHTWSK